MMVFLRILGFVSLVNLVFGGLNEWQPSFNSVPIFSISKGSTDNKEKYITPYQTLGNLQPTVPRPKPQPETSFSFGNLNTGPVHPVMLPISPIGAPSAENLPMISIDATVAQTAGENIQLFQPSAGIQKSMQIVSGPNKVLQLDVGPSIVQNIIDSSGSVLDRKNGRNIVGYRTVLENRMIPVVTLKRQPVVRMRQVVSKVPVVRMVTRHVALPGKY